MYKFALVPLYETYGPDSISEVLNDTKIETLCCNSIGIEKIILNKNLKYLKNLICLDDEISEDLMEKVK